MTAGFGGCGDEIFFAVVSDSGPGLLSSHASKPGDSRIQPFSEVIYALRSRRITSRTVV